METKRADNIRPIRETTQPPERDPPVNLEAEQALLGAILANNSAFERVSDFLRAEHFADAAHGRIYDAAQRLIERGQNANAVTLKNYFDRDEGLAEVGGAQYLARLQALSVAIINAGDYGRTIHDLYLRRQLIDLGQEVVNDAFEHDLESDAMAQIEQTEQRLFSLAETGTTGRDFKSFKETLAEAIAMTEAALKRESGVAGVATGFKDLDLLLGGLQNSDLVILAGRPAMGKSSLATNIAYNVCSSQRWQRAADGSEITEPQPVAFFSLEMSAEQLATRILSEQAHVSSSKMRRGEISEEEFNRVFEANKTLAAHPLYIDDTPALSVSGLRTRARRLKRKVGLSLIVIDYLQLMQGSGKTGDSRVQEVSEITRGLKAVAKELDVPVLALSQLSRQTEQRDDKRPQLADLRESGSIEQDADVVLFIFREEYYLAREKPTQRDNESADKFNERQANYEERLNQVASLAEVIVGKQRHGPIGTATLHFNGEFTQFSDYLAGDHLPPTRD
jgi:replicative DNA helicase